MILNFEATPLVRRRSLKSYDHRGKAEPFRNGGGGAASETNLPGYEKRTGNWPMNQLPAFLGLKTY